MYRKAANILPTFTAVYKVSIFLGFDCNTVYKYYSVRADMLENIPRLADKSVNPSKEIVR